MKGHRFVSPTGNMSFACVENLLFGSGVSTAWISFHFKALIFLIIFFGGRVQLCFVRLVLLKHITSRPIYLLLR